MHKSKRVLLMTPPQPPLGTSPMHYGDGRPMLGLGFLAAYIEKFGHRARIIDNFIEPHDTEQEISRFQPDFIGLYVNTTSYMMALKLIREIRKTTQIPIICGGPHASILPDTLVDFADYVVVGEGERALKAIIETAPKEKIIRYAFIKDLDMLPWPDYSHFIDNPHNWKLTLFNDEAEPVLTMNTSRGCPYRCTFCSVEAVWGKSYRVFSASRIVEEIEHLMAQYGAKGIYFREDNFTAHRKRLAEFCGLIEQKKLQFVWTCETRADLEDHFIERMAKTGCHGVYVGLENGCQRILDLMNKNISLGQIRKFFKRCRKAGIKTYASVCYGIPGETENDRKISEEFLLEVAPDALDRFVYTGLPGSPLYKYIKENKLYYHIDESRFLYTDSFKELIPRYCPATDNRVNFLRRQDRSLKMRRRKVK
ncbi:MAG: radical SAM protein [Acidobacteriota bacterium]|nr:radical SAM protein [Acidobacteriota bacterium]